MQTVRLRETATILTRVSNGGLASGLAPLQVQQLGTLPPHWVATEISELSKIDITTRNLRQGLQTGSGGPEILRRREGVAVGLAATRVAITMEEACRPDQAQAHNLAAAVTIVPGLGELGEDRKCFQRVSKLLSCDPYPNRLFIKRHATLPLAWRFPPRHLLDTCLRLGMLFA